MPFVEKKLFGVIMLALLVLSIVFWGTMAGGIFVITLSWIFQISLFDSYADSETFEVTKKNQG